MSCDVGEVTERAGHPVFVVSRISGTPPERTKERTPRTHTPNSLLISITPPGIESQVAKLEGKDSSDQA